jgi:HEPN domain-containing protein
MTIDEQVKYWMELAEQDLPVAESLFEKKHYMYCLYLGHLVLEKTLKAYYVKTLQKTPPKTHDLLKLSEATSLNLTEEQEEFLNRVTDFNIESRYPDYKSNFYTLCTKEFTSENFNKIKEFYGWMQNLLK